MQAYNTPHCVDKSERELPRDPLGARILMRVFLSENQAGQQIGTQVKGILVFYSEVFEHEKIFVVSVEK